MIGRARPGHAAVLALAAGRGLRQLDPEAAALAVRGLDAHHAVHALDRALHHRQPDAGAGVLRAMVEALERHEDALVVFGRDADPVVLAPQPYAFAATLRTHRDLRAAVGRDELDRVHDQVPDHL